MRYAHAGVYSLDFVPVTKYTRAGYKGKHILCPNCRSISKVYHFAWSGLGCQHCGKMIDKQMWEVGTQ